MFTFPMFRKFLTPMVYNESICQYTRMEIIKNPQYIINLEPIHKSITMSKIGFYIWMKMMEYMTMSGES